MPAGDLGTARVALGLAAGHAAIDDQVAKQAGVERRTDNQQRQAGEHGDGAVAPAIAAGERGRAGEEPEAEQRLAPAVTLGAYAAAALAQRRAALVVEDGVGHEDRAEEPDHDGQEER